MTLSEIIDRYNYEPTSELISIAMCLLGKISNSFFIINASEDFPRVSTNHSNIWIDISYINDSHKISEEICLFHVELLDECGAPADSIDTNSMYEAVSIVTIHEEGHRKWIFRGEGGYDNFDSRVKLFAYC